MHAPDIPLVALEPIGPDAGDRRFTGDAANGPTRQPRQAPAAARSRLCNSRMQNGSSWYLHLLTWSFTFFSSARVVAYLPTFWSILQSGDSSQHSLWTWLGWLGANVTTAAWLYENDGRRMGPVALASTVNAANCFAISVLIVWYRL